MSDPIVPAGGPTGGFTFPVPQLFPGAPGPKTAPVDPGGIAVSTPQISTQAQAQTENSAKATEHAPAQAALVESAMTQIREFVKKLPPDIQFSEDRSSGHVVFKVVNPITHEVIRQFPPEEILVMARRLKALAEGGTGLLIDQKS
jgi:flagellar protein FlaG